MDLSNAVMKLAAYFWRVFLQCKSAPLACRVARTFCPHSQIDLHRVSAPEEMVGRELQFKVTVFPHLPSVHFMDDITRQSVADL